MSIYIKEVFVNETKGYIIGDSAAWYEAYTDDLGVLYRSLKSEYGNARNIYRDNPVSGKSVKIGWCFTGKAKYEDTGESFTRSVWIEVSTKPIVVLETPTSPWK